MPDKMPLSDLYFVGILPTPAIQTEVTALKEIFKLNYQSKHALKSPPHITLIPPFKCSEADLNQVKMTISTFCSTWAPFSIQLRGFGAFEPRVIFIRVEKNQHLKTLQNKLERQMADRFDFILPARRPFHPHLTIAFKDLSASQFHRAWPTYQEKEYTSEFSCNALNMLAYRQVWTVQEEFMLGPQ